jgi:hypothetical protein
VAVSAKWAVRVNPGGIAPTATGVPLCNYEMSAFMKYLVAIPLLTGLTFGQTLQSPVAFVPFGPWPICQADQSVPYLNSLFGGANYCATFIKGTEPDLLSIKSSNPSTTDFLYIVTGVDTTGAGKTVTGHFARHDNTAGFSSTIVIAGMTTAIVTIVEYSYDPYSGSFLMLQNNTGLYPLTGSGLSR